MYALPSTPVVEVADFASAYTVFSFSGELDPLERRRPI